MAFRFQRRIKIAPGLMLVASKRGVGVSAGAPGARVSVTRAGVHGHAGIPGTGLAYREKLNKKGRRQAAGAFASDAVQDLQSGSSFSVTISLDDNGEVVLLGANGRQLSEDQTKILRRAAGEQLREQLRVFCEGKNAEVKALERIHHDTPEPRAEPEFTPRKFALLAPDFPTMIEATFWSKVWPPAKRQRETENTARRAAHEGETREWQAARDAFKAEEDARRIRETESVFTDLEAMTLTLEDHLTEIPWPCETDVDFDLGDDSRTIAITLHLPDEESLSTEEWSVPGNRIKVTKKKLAVTRRRGIYRDYVHGVAVRVVGEIFARLPTIRFALVSGVTPGVDPATGHPAEVALYSVIAGRDAWSNLNFDAIHSMEPAETLALFDLRRAMSKTGIMKPVKAFTLEQLELAAG